MRTKLVLTTVVLPYHDIKKLSINTKVVKIVDFYNFCVYIYNFLCDKFYIFGANKEKFKKFDFFSKH